MVVGQENLSVFQRALVYVRTLGLSASRRLKFDKITIQNVERAVSPTAKVTFARQETIVNKERHD